MSTWIYQIAGVRRPRNNPDTLITIADRYSALASAASSHRTEVQSIVKGVQAENKGPTVDAFSARQTGAGSAAHQLTLIGEFATRTSSAYLSTAAEFTAGVLAMDTVATQAYATIVRLLMDPTTVRIRMARAVMEKAKAQLKALEAATHNAVASSMSRASAAPLLDVGSQRPNESLPQEVEDRWDDLDQEQKEKILKLMAEDYARRHGIPVPEIKYFDKNSEEGKKGWAGYWDGTTLHINSDMLDNGVAMNIVAHEMGHAVQTHAMNAYDSYSAQDIADMKAGRRPDEFARYGMSAAEVQRLKEASSHYENDGPRYRRAPSEIDAGRSAYEFSDDLTLSKLEDYIRRAG